MSSTQHTDIEELAMYALLLLSEEEAAEVRAHQQVCESCRAELAQVREDLALFALTVEPVQPPEGARERFLTRLRTDHAPQSPIPTSPKQAVPGAPAPLLVQRRNEPTSAVLRILPWIGWAAAAAAIIVALGLKEDRDALRGAFAAQNADNATTQRELARDRHILGVLTDPDAVRVNLTTSKVPATPTARATYEQKSGTLLLLASNLPALQPAKVYELWLIPADGSKPLPAGVFSPDARGNASLLVSSLHGAVAAKAFGITVEQAGGSETPTLPILLAGAPA